MLKKIFKITGIVFLVLLLLAFLLPVFFKGKILAVTRKQINDHVNARVDFSDVSLSLFRHFPGISVALEDLDVVGLDDFSQDTLISAKRIDVAVNLFSLIGSGPMQINSISVDNPRIHALVHADGKPNWSISKPDTAAATPAGKDSAGSFHLELKAYSISNGYLYYQDVPGNMNCEISGLNHSGSGDFTSDLFTLKTKTSADAASFTYAKIPYLFEVKTALGADIEVDNRNDKYSFKTDDIALNDLKLSTEGYFQFVNDTTYGMDIRFSAPSTDFKTLLSLVPAVYKNDFRKIETSGKALFNGFVKGEYNSVKIPAYQVNLNVDNGFFKYPDLPEPVKNIGIALKIDNPDGVTDHTVVDISKGHIEFGNDPFDFRLLLKNPLTDQYVEAAVKGKLNLAQVTKFVKLSPGTTLSGLVDADAQAKGNVATVLKQKPGVFSANGVIALSGLNYTSKDFPAPVKNTSVQINFENTDGTADHTMVKIPAGHVEIGGDPIDFSLLLKNPVSNLYFEGSAKGRFNLASVAQFTTLAPGTSLSGRISADMNFKGNKSSIDAKDYGKIYSAGSLNIVNLLYKSKDYPGGISVPQAAFTFNPQNITLNSASAVYLNTHYTASGTLDNAIGYALKDEPVSGTLAVKADNIDLNQLMGSMPATATDSSKPAAGTQPATNGSTAFAVPKNIAFILNAAIDKLKYDKVIYSNVKGTIAIKDESVALKEVTMDALDGKIGASGLYSTKASRKNPDISFAYELSGLDVQKTFLAFNTVQLLMPAGRYVTGKVNSHLTMSGSLNQHMSPDLKSLTGNGTLDMIDGALKNFTPLEKLSALLHIDALNNTSLKDIKLSYDFANGRVLVKPFRIKAAGVNMDIAGTHGFDQTIDYVIGVKMPRSMLGSQANALISTLSQQATAKGIPVKVSDSINLNVRMTGTMSNPQLKSGLNSSGSGGIGEAVQQQATVFAKQAVDSAKTLLTDKKNDLKDSAASIKNQAIKDLQSDLGKAISGQKDSANGKPLQNTQKNAEDALKNTLNGLFQKKK